MTSPKWGRERESLQFNYPRFRRRIISLTISDSSTSPRPPPIPEQSEQPDIPKPEAAREQKITPFDVEGEVDAEGRNLGM